MCLHWLRVTFVGCAKVAWTALVSGGCLAGLQLRLLGMARNGRKPEMAGCFWIAVSAGRALEERQ